MKIKALVCDMDGTAVQYPNGEFASSWDILTEILSDEQKKEWFSLADKYYGKGNYEEWFRVQMRLLEGKKLSDAERFLFPIPYSPGFKEFFSNSNGLKKAILTAGIDIVARRIAEEFNFDCWISQQIEIKNGIFTGEGKNIVNPDKSKHLYEISKILQVPLLETCYIGDTEGDITCLETVGFPVAFNPHHGLDDYAKTKRIPRISNFRELNGIIELQK